MRRVCSVERAKQVRLNPTKPKSPSSINVPQEFAGMSMGELHTRGGQVKGMDVLSNDVLIRASVPESGVRPTPENYRRPLRQPLKPSNRSDGCVSASAGGADYAED